MTLYYSQYITFNLRQLHNEMVVLNKRIVRGIDVTKTLRKLAAIEAVLADREE